jgi:hypothetical protein
VERSDERICVIGDLRAGDPPRAARTPPSCTTSPYAASSAADRVAMVERLASWVFCRGLGRRAWPYVLGPYVGVGLATRDVVEPS